MKIYKRTGLVPFKMMGNWPMQVNMLKAKFSKLTDEDLKYEKGKEAELLDRIEKRIEVSKDVIISIIKEGQQT